MFRYIFFIGVLLMLLIGLSGCSHDTVSETRQDKPNVLILMADEHVWDAFGAAGHPIVQTPQSGPVGSARCPVYCRLRQLACLCGGTDVAVNRKISDGNRSAG